jgi:DNA repair ATPase RecN
VSEESFPDAKSKCSFVKVKEGEEALLRESRELLEESKTTVDETVDALRTLAGELRDVAAELREAARLSRELAERLKEVPDEVAAWMADVANVLLLRELDLSSLAGESLTMLRLARAALEHLEEGWRGA